MLLRFLFILPLLMSLIWWWYLQENNYTIKQGLKGFGYIAAFNAIIISFFTLMIYLTQ